MRRDFSGYINLPFCRTRFESSKFPSASQETSGTEHMEKIWAQCSTLAGDVQALSHELHPSILDNLGLMAAVKSFCRELSEQSGAQWSFRTRIFRTLFCGKFPSLFRVIQEALRNAVKYSGEKRFEVYLHGKAGEIDLEISNRGVGFDVSRAKGNRGWGLVNMAERVHLVNGTFNVDSQLNGGTRICVRVPVGTKPKAPTSDAN